MQTKNICKFTPNPTDDKIIINCFIYETNEDTMKNTSVSNNHCMYLIKSGKGKFMFDDNYVPYSVGYLIFGFEGEKTAVLPDENTEYMYIKFSGARAENLFRRFGINKYLRCFTDFDGILPLWYDSLSRASNENIDITAEGILLYTFSRLNSIPANENNLINKIIDFSEKNFTNPNLSLASLSKQLVYNSKYLSHFFKEKMNIGYTEYLRNLRIKYAVTLLDHGIDSVKNISYLSGFSDPLYFSTVFKKTIGISPKEYKLRYTNKPTA